MPAFPQRLTVFTDTPHFSAYLRIGLLGFFGWSDMAAAPTFVWTTLNTTAKVMSSQKIGGSNYWDELTPSAGFAAAANFFDATFT